MITNPDMQSATSTFEAKQWSVAEQLQQVRQTIPPTTRLIAVSKTKPIEALQEAYNSGQRLFGENKAQEMRLKYEALPKDIQWHFIGHLQTNKIKYIAPFVSLIHSIDSLALLQAVDKEAAKNGRTIDCLLQFHIAQEQTKFGLNLDEATAMLASDDYKRLEHVRIIGVMGMATNTTDTTQVSKEFANLHAIFTTLKETHFATEPHFKELSMGMTHDYNLAIEQGATFVRIGSLIFGARDYNKPVND